MSLKKKINLTNLLFFILTPLVAIGGTAALLMTIGVPWQTWVLAAVMIFLTGLSITGGYHRLFSHQTYQANWFIKLIYLLFGAAAFEGSVLEWGTDHRNHHRYVDTEKDPYNINEGFWYAHIGWLFTLDTSKRDFSNVEDLQKDRLVALQHRFFVPVALFMCFAFPALVAMCWGDPLGGLIIAGALRMVFNHHGTFFINSACHVFGSRTYNSKQTARDNWFTAFFTFGEGFHNFHHQFALDYRNGVRWFHYDPTKWLIKGLSYIGMAKNLKQVPEHLLMKYRLQTASDSLWSDNTHKLTQIWGNLLCMAEPVKLKMHTLVEQLEAIDREYRQLLRSGDAAIKKAAMTPKQLQALYKKRVQELKGHWRQWQDLAKQRVLMGAATPA